MKILSIIILFLISCRAEEDTVSEPKSSCEEYCLMVSNCFSQYEYDSCLGSCSEDLERATQSKSEKCYELYEEGYICQGELTCSEWLEFLRGETPYPCESVESNYLKECKSIKNV